MPHPAPLLCIAAISIAVGTQPGGSGGAGNGAQPKTVPLTPRAPFDDCREAMLKAPMAERITVTVRARGQSPASANILLRTAPGKERDQRDAKVSIEAGDMRVYAEGGVLTAVAASNPTTYYSVDLEGPATPAALAKALHPLPLPELAVFFAPGGSPVSTLTPVTRPITWEGTTVTIDPPPTQIPLNGTVDGKPGAQIQFEFQPDPQDRRAATRLRIRSFTCPLPTPGGEERTISTSSAWLDPGDPASWKIATEKRTRVDSLAALGIRVEPPATPPEKKTEPEKKAEGEKKAELEKKPDAPTGG